MKIKVKRIIHYKENFHGKLNDIYLMLPDYIYELLNINGQGWEKNPPRILKKQFLAMELCRLAIHLKQFIHVEFFFLYRAPLIHLKLRY